MSGGQEDDARGPGTGLSDDSLFHVFTRLDLRSLAVVGQVCRKWRSTLANVWGTRRLDVDELLRMGLRGGESGGLARAQRRFAALATGGVCRPGQLKLSADVLPAPFLFHLRHAFGENLRELDCTGVAITNADLNCIPGRVYQRLRTLLVAPEEPVISILSLAPVAASCRSLRHLRWSGFVVLKAALFAELLQRNPGLSTLRIEAHMRGWLLQNEHLRVLTDAGNAPMTALTDLSLQYGRFDGKSLEGMMMVRGRELTRLDLRGCFVAGSVNVCAVVAKFCPCLRAFFVSEDSTWKDAELPLAVLKSLEWIGSDSSGGWTAVSQLAERATSDDMVLLSQIDLSLLDSAFEYIVKQQALFPLDKDLVAATLLTRLRGRVLSDDAAIDLTVGAVEWLLSERCQLVRYFRLDDLTLVPIFQI